MATTTDMRPDAFALRWAAGLVLAGLSLAPSPGSGAEPAELQVGLAVRDVTPPVPIRLAGYAARKRPADRVDQPLLAQALAWRNPTGERFVLVALDNCEVSRAFMEPVLAEYAARFQLARGQVAVVCSHTHSGPVLDDVLSDMVDVPAEDRAQIAAYSRQLRTGLVEVVGAALADVQPAQLEYGLGRATFAMNRRVYQGDRVVFGDNPDGPVDWDVPVLRLRGTNGAVRAVLFGYACHGTSVRTGDDWYVVSPEYMGYARRLLEAHLPGARALFVPGFGADADPAPRGQLVHAQQHGLELAGAVMAVLNRPMRSVRGPFRFAYREVSLPLVEPPDRAQLEKDAQSADRYVRARAAAYLKRLDAGQPLPRAVDLPVGVLRLGDDLTVVLMGGEVVVDYSRRLKRLLAADHPWLVAYAYETPCYIPSIRLIKEGGYESDYSLVYYGYYGPFQTAIEDRLVQHVLSLVSQTRSR